MQQLKGFEQHSYNSLAKRFDYLVSRQTLTEWIAKGVIRPAQITSENRNTHLLFSTKKLNAIHHLMKKAQIYHAMKVPPSNRQTFAQRLATGRRHAEAVALGIEKRRKAGQPHGRGPDPALNPDDAVGRTHLTFDPKQDKNLIRIFGGFGKWKT